MAITPRKLYATSIKIGYAGKLAMCIDMQASGLHWVKMDKTGEKWVKMGKTGLKRLNSCSRLAMK